jgi:uncharacterized protein with FMN-binding domain
MPSHPLRLLREAKAPAEELHKLLAEHVVFHSPIFAKPVVGRDLVAKVMQQAVQVREGQYTYELRDGSKTILVWSGKIDGHKLESFELIEDDDQGRIVSRTVAMRPFPVVAIFRDAMFARLGGLLTEDFWTL